jgi:hypothetical protein
MASPLSLTEPDWFTSPERGCADPPYGVSWFPPDVEHKERSKNFDSTPAKQICRRCPFRAPCLEYSLRENQKYGIWGGLDERQRRAIQRCLKGKCGTRCTHPYRERRAL